MPSNYAHYRFGVQALASLPADVRRPIQRFRRLYDVGVHGPDLFLYHNLMSRTIPGVLDGKFHRQTGRDYFTRACKKLKQEPTEAGLAYLYGVLAHYCLDSVCCPFVHEKSGERQISPRELETEFDRYLLLLDGIDPPHTYDGSRHMRLTRGECVTVSEFYPPATPDIVQQSVRNMARLTRTLTAPEGAKRSAVKKLLTLTAPAIKGLIMPTHPNHRCTDLDGELLALYDRAMELYPTLVEQLIAHMTYNGILGDDFAATFHGKRE